MWLENFQNQMSTKCRADNFTPLGHSLLLTGNGCCTYDCPLRQNMPKSVRCLMHSSVQFHHHYLIATLTAIGTTTVCPIAIATIV